MTGAAPDSGNREDLGLLRDRDPLAVGRPHRIGGVLRQHALLRAADLVDDESLGSGPPPTTTSLLSRFAFTRVRMYAIDLPSGDHTGSPPRSRHPRVSARSFVPFGLDEEIVGSRAIERNAIVLPSGDGRGDQSSL